MDDQGTVAEAVSVDARGRILKVGTERELTAEYGSGVELVRLEPRQVLMPGFIEPHMHILATLLAGLPVVQKVEPCLPGPYGEATKGTSCTNWLEGALESLRPSPASSKDSSQAFIVAMNLDPSRQQAPEEGESVCGKGPVPFPFMHGPKQYLEQCVSNTRPVFIMDQSGHLAYVNQEAIDRVCKPLQKKGEACPPASIKSGGGEWVTDPKGQFTGLIREPPAFQPFLEAMAQAELEESLLHPFALLHANPVRFIERSAESIRKTIQGLRKAGITTLADGGLTSVPQIDAVKLLAGLKDFPVRMTALVRYDVAYDLETNREKLQPTGPACDPRREPSCELPKWLGVGGIKLWVDGSTQGCTAGLEQPYSYKDSGHCGGLGPGKEGRNNYPSASSVADQLRGLWLKGNWRFQLHANGNEANQWVIDAFTALQQEARNPHPVLFIHDTVGSEEITRQIGHLRDGTFVTKDGTKLPPLNASVTHLIGHVAYWGDSFAHMLSGDAAGNLDPIGFDRRHRVPFSLHSDSTVTPPRPLWYVEQAVTRRTWVYPGMKESYVLGRDHAATVEEALRAITLEPARQHGLDPWLGSIEPGKVADFVVLSANPLDYEPTRGGNPEGLRTLEVVRTYLNGRPTVEDGP